ncbi:MAG: hypothetical protein A2066_14720 [Bacteroidetes bacterium GWB2_41_8]|nr:MAG: hypothetical protein A2066_14720 [Bacteroidetes bacterium GWB2_41_8]
MTKILNIYIKRPLLYDLFICSFIVFCIEYFQILTLTVSLDSAKSTISDVVNTSISLAGFILAALTIIVTFKDNITHKEKSDPAKNSVEASGFELIFSSKHYKRIVGVFSWAAIIYILLFLIFSVLKILLSKIPEKFYLDIVIVGIVLVALTIFRSLLVLYKVIKLQIKNQ